MQRYCAWVFLGFPLLFFTAAASEESASPTLRALAEQRGFLIGAAVNERTLRSDAAYGALLAREYSFLTSENSMKFGNIQPSRGEFDWSNADTLVAFCEAHGMAVHGHTLLWHSQRPDWLKRGATFSREEMTEILTSHISRFVGRYKGRIRVWDVVNEALLPPNEEADGWRRGTPWFDALGPDYLPLAFRLAHEADPDAMLVYNDYGAEAENPKSETIYRILGDSLERGVPIHGIGFQYHVSMERALDPAFIASAERNMQRFADLGLKIYITELDLPIVGEKTVEAYQRQAEAYGNIMAAALRQPACKGVQVWGVSDRSSWLTSFSEPKGTPKDPLPFDDRLQPKPAYDAIRAALMR